METSIYPPEYMEAVYMVRTLEKEKRALSIIKKFGGRVKNAAVAFSGKDSLVALHTAMKTFKFLRFLGTWTRFNS